jgi:predicted Zn-dependent protease
VIDGILRNTDLKGKRERAAFVGRTRNLTAVMTLASLLNCAQPSTAPVQSIAEPPAQVQAPVDLYDITTLPNPTVRQKVWVWYNPLDHAETAPFRKHEREIFEGVRKFYATHGIDINYLSSVPVGDRHNGINIVLVDEDLYRILVPGPLKYKVLASGHSEKQNHIVYIRGWETDIEYEREEPEEFIWVSIDTVAHEIGHILGLGHWPRPLVAPNIKSLMWWKNTTVKGCTGFCSDITEGERRIMHSFLSKGQMYRAYQEAETPDDYARKLEETTKRRLGIK